MGKDTNIEWTHHSWNTHWGCQKVSPGCKNCYAESFSKRFGESIWGVNHKIKHQSEAYWKLPYKWDKQAANNGEQWRVFSNSMSDFFEDHPELPALRKQAFRIIEETPNLIWMLLTKHPDNIRDMIPQSWHENFPENVWLGTSVELPEYLWRLDYIAGLGASATFVSFEPLLGSIHRELLRYLVQRGEQGYETILDQPTMWIFGGESGSGARYTDPQWIVDVVGLGNNLHNVYPFVKQLGSVWAKQNGAKHKKGGDINEWPVELQVREVPNV